MATSYRELSQSFPRPGWVEHDPTEIWRAARETASEAASACGQAVAALGIANQRETVVAWDTREARPLCPAIVWQDRRTAGRTEQLGEAGHLPLVRSLTGLVLDPYFSATKIEWMLREGGLEAGPHTVFGTVDAWLAWNLTGGPLGARVVTDPSNASRTLLFDTGTMDWSDELCELFGVPRASLPEVVPSAGRVGTMAADAIGERGAGVPVSGMAGDQQSALFGQACLEAGMTKATYGTGGFVLMNVGAGRPEPVEGLVSSVAWDLGAHSGGAPEVSYALEGSIFSAGATLQWLRDGLGILREPSETEALARSVASSDGLYLVPAFAGLGSPWWDPRARGALVGVTRGSGRAHLARAAVEAMAFQVRDVVSAMVSDTSRSLTALRVDGGASAMDLLLELQADQLQTPVARPAVRETTALGAAYLAGLAEGVWSSTEEIAGLWSADAEFRPSVPPGESDPPYAGWRRAVERSMRWAG